MIKFSAAIDMVPTEEDVEIEIRKENEYGEPEGSKRKRKTKEISRPRPACSWVHFSQEFIREYSASHPESSGLKPATKAASNAWKLMSPEEKAKYTARSREVWDEYLAMVPAQPPKPRKQTKLVTRCSPSRLLNVLQRLTPDQKDAVENMGFGSILGLRCRTLRRSLCLWLLERFNTVRRCLEICGERIPLTPRDVELVMGLPSNGKDVPNSASDESILDLRKQYNASKRGISIRLLEERLSLPEAGDDFRRSFILYVLGTLLCPTARLDVSPTFLHFLTNMDVVHEYNWGKFLLDRLVREVSRYRLGKQRAVGGCLLFLQLFYYESIAVGDINEMATVSFPCLFTWGEEEISEREKREKELGGYGSGEVVCRERGLGMGSPGYNSYVDAVMPLRMELGPSVEEDDNSGDAYDNDNEESPMSGEIEETPLGSRAACQNTEFGCPITIDYHKKKAHEEACKFSPCSCPIKSCKFNGSSEQLSLHFSSKHWDSGRRFQYDYPLPVSLAKDDKFLVLQAESDGVLFLLNKGTENIGFTVMVTCISPCSRKDRFSYDLLSERGSSSLRLRSYTCNYPGRVEGFPPDDFLVVPHTFLNSSGRLDVDVCIWKSDTKELAD